MSTCLATARATAPQDFVPRVTVRSNSVADNRPKPVIVPVQSERTSPMNSAVAVEAKAAPLSSGAGSLPKPLLFCIYMVALFGIGFAVRELWHMMIYIVATAAPNLASAAATLPSAA